MLALLLVAFSLGLSNFAAAIGIGVAGTGARTRLRVGIVFGLFEAGMPVLGLVLGRGLASTLGSAARWIGAVLLIVTGGYALIQALRGSGEEAPALAVGGTGRLLVRYSGTEMLARVMVEDERSLNRRSVCVYA